MPQDEEVHEEARASALLHEMQRRIAGGPHATLGVPLHATAADIRQAFLKLTKTYHPTKFGRMSTEIQKLSTEIFLALRGAHDQLAKQNKRPSTGMLPIVTPTHPLASGTVAAVAREPSTPVARPAQSRTPTDEGLLPPQPSARSDQSIARPTPSRMTALRRPPTSPPPNPRRSTPALGSRVLPSAKTPPIAPPSQRADSSASMPALGDLGPVYDLMQRGQWEQARSAINVLAARNATDKTKYDALLHYTRGREAQLERRLDDARVELDSALQLDPTLQIAKTALAELFLRRR